MLIRASSFILAVATLGYGVVASAALISVSTSDNQVISGVDNQGWWRLDDTNLGGTNDNYFAGMFDLKNLNNYFSFDLAGITGTVVSASLEVRRYNTDTGATLNLFDVSTSAVDLAQRTVIDNAIVIDLGSGTNYGSFVAGSGDTLDIMSFSLNAAALVDINSSLGSFFSIGGTSTGGNHFANSNFEPGNTNTNFVQRLVLVTDAVSVPEPSTLAYLVLAC